MSNNSNRPSLNPLSVERSLILETSLKHYPARVLEDWLQSVDPALSPQEKVAILLHKANQEQ